VTIVCYSHSNDNNKILNSSFRVRIKIPFSFYNTPTRTIFDQYFLLSRKHSYFLFFFTIVSRIYISVSQTSIVKSGTERGKPFLRAYHKKLVWLMFFFVSIISFKILSKTSTMTSLCKVELINKYSKSVRTIKNRVVEGLK